MKTLWKRSLALLLCLILCGSLLPVHALAEGETEPAIPEEESAVLPEEDAPAEEPDEPDAQGEEPDAPSGEPELPEDPAGEEPAAEEPEAEAVEPEADPAEAEAVDEDAAAPEFDLNGEGTGNYLMSSGGSLGLTVIVNGSTSGDDMADVTVGWNCTVALKVKATVNSGSLKYQWYTVAENDINFDTGKFTYRSKNAISGATSAKYTTPKVTWTYESAKYYACVVTDKKGATASAMFKVGAAIGLTDLDQPKYAETLLESTPEGVFLCEMSGITFAQGQVLIETANDTIQSPEDNYPFATKYQIYRKASGGSWTALKTVTADKSSGNFGAFTTYVDTTAKMGTKYAYKYRAYLNGAWSPFTIASSITFNPFQDVSEDDGYFSRLAWAYNNKVVAHDTDLFRPHESCTRGEFAEMLYNLAGRPSVKGKTHPFTDVPSEYEKAITWAYNKKIIAGTTPTTFSPESNVQRCQIVLMLWKMAGRPKVSVKNPFTDVSSSASSYKAVLWAVKNKITSGTSATTFSPNDNCARYQLVTFLYKFNKLMKFI